MGKVLSALLHLQTIERQLSDVRRRLNARQNAVAAQEKRIAEFREDWQALHDQGIQCRKAADGFELELKQREEKVVSLRNALNQAKTNKEYAAILTQINTIKADNTKLEEQALEAMQKYESVKAEADELQIRIESEQKRLEEITAFRAQ